MKMKLILCRPEKGHFLFQFVCMPYDSLTFKKDRFANKLEMHWDFQNVHFLIARMSSGHFLKRCISPSKCTSHEFCHMYILSHSHTCAAVTTCLSQSYTCVQHHPQHAYISAAILLNCGAADCNCHCCRTWWGVAKSGHGWKPDHQCLWQTAILPACSR